MVLRLNQVTRCDCPLQCISDPPGPPMNMQVKDLTKSSCTLKWEPPAFDGGSPIKGYYVEKSTGYSTRWIKVGNNPSPQHLFPQ